MNNEEKYFDDIEEKPIKEKVDYSQYILPKVGPNKVMTTDSPFPPCIHGKWNCCYGTDNRRR